MTALSALLERKTETAGRTGEKGMSLRSKRLHLALPEGMQDRINTLKEVTQAESQTEVVRNALLVYSALVNEHLRGNDVLVRSPDGKEVTYKVFLN
jgi:hypothetical protein